jgi:formylglycine-generating enzyme required for sulfatase activity
MPVGRFAANPWGLFNVHGNAFDWCADVLAPSGFLRKAQQVGAGVVAVAASLATAQAAAVRFYPQLLMRRVVRI